MCSSLPGCVPTVGVPAVGVAAVGVPDGGGLRIAVGVSCRRATLCVSELPYFSVVVLGCVLVGGLPYLPEGAEPC